MIPTEILEKIEEIIQFILYPEITGWLLILKIIFLAISSIFLGFIIWALLNTDWLKRLILWDLKEFLTYRPYLMRKYVKEWKKIKKRLTTGLESEAKLAIIEADSLLNETLKNMGYPGKSLGERLDELTPDILSNLGEVREAHKIYSDIIHDPTYRLNLDQAERALSIYEKALSDLQAL